MDSSKAKSRLAVLSASLDQLEDDLQPLLAQTLPETLLGLEGIQQAKTLVDIVYVVYDLVFVYLKSRGIDPKTHPVIPELERVKTYFAKIKDIENPPQRTTQIDKAAASRFIQHAISSVTIAPSPPPVPSTSKAEPVPAKVTTKMIERQEYEERIRKEDAEDDGEEPELQVFDDETETEKKRKRPRIDHFADVGETEPAPSTTSKKKKKQKLSSTETSAASPAPEKKEKKKKSKK